MAKAEKKLKGGMFGNLFGNKKDEAVELFQEAANKYKQVLALALADSYFDQRAPSSPIRTLPARQRSGLHAVRHRKELQSYNYSSMTNLGRQQRTKRPSRCPVVSSYLY